MCSSLRANLMELNLWIGTKGTRFGWFNADIPFIVIFYKEYLSNAFLPV